MAVQCNGGKQWLDIHFIKQIWSACHNPPDLWLFYWDHMKLGSKKGQMPLLNPQNLLKSFSGFSVASWTQRQSIVGMANWALLDTGILLSSTSANPPHLSLQHEAAKLFKFTQQTRVEKAPRLTVYQSSYLHLAV